MVERARRTGHGRARKKVKAWPGQRDSTNPPIACHVRIARGALLFAYLGSGAVAGSFFGASHSGAELMAFCRLDFHPRYVICAALVSKNLDTVRVSLVLICLIFLPEIYCLLVKFWGKKQ